MKGIAILPLILIIGAIALEIAVVGGVLSFFGSGSNFSIKSGKEAFFTARTGVEDAFLRIVRDKNFVTASPYSISIYSGSNITTASVFVYNSGTNEKKAVATSTVFNRAKTVIAVIRVDSVTGETKVISINEESS